MDYDQKNQFRMSGEYNDSHTNTILVALGDKNGRKMVDGVYCGAYCLIIHNALYLDYTSVKEFHALGAPC